MGRNIVSALPKHTVQAGKKKREQERDCKEALDTTQINLEKFMQNWNKRGSLPKEKPGDHASLRSLCY